MTASLPVPGWASGPGDPGIYADSRAYRSETPAGPPAILSFEDGLGRVDRLVSGGVSLNLLYSRANTLRGGDIHMVAQHDVLISGRVELWTFSRGESHKAVLTADQHAVIMPHVPHLFSFDEDTVMVEWWDGGFEAWHWRPWRELVEEQLA